MFTGLVVKLLDPFPLLLRPQEGISDLWTLLQPLWRPLLVGCDLTSSRCHLQDSSLPVWGTYSTLGWCMCCSFPALPPKPCPSPERQCVLTGPATTMTASPRHGGAAREPALTCCQKEHSAVCAGPSLLRQTSGPADHQAEFVWSLQQQFRVLLRYWELLLKPVGTFSELKLHF